MKNGLRDYQNAAIDALVKARPECAYIEMASGLGKTFFAAAFTRLWLRIVGQHVLFLVHMTDALEQARAEFEERFAGSGITTGILAGRNKEELEAPVLFATFQTMYNMLDEFPDDHFTLVIVDEAHHGPADTYLEVIEHFEGVQLRLGLTATPKRMDGKDIDDVFGEKVYSYSLAEALADRKYLADVDYRLMTDNISPEELLRFLDRVRKGDRRISKSELNAKVFLTEYLEGVAEQVETVRSEKGLLKTIIFCRNISHLRRVQKHFPNAKPYHSELSAGVREQRLRKFRSGELSEILVVDMFNEAIDIPDADLLVFLRATESETVWRQQLGRGLRRNGDKEKCVVVLDFVANCDRLYMIRSFTKEVEECLSEKEKSAPGLPTAPTGWQVNFTAELIDVVKVLDFLDIDSWEYRYDELKAFHAEHGHCNVPKGWKENPALGTWVSNQRKVYKEGKLSEERTQQLEALGFVWRRIKRKKK